MLIAVGGDSVGNIFLEIRANLVSRSEHHFILVGGHLRFTDFVVYPGFCQHGVKALPVIGLIGLKDFYQYQISYIISIISLFSK